MQVSPYTSYGDGIGVRLFHPWRPLAYVNKPPCEFRRILLYYFATRFGSFLPSGVVYSDELSAFVLK